MPKPLALGSIRERGLMLGLISWIVMALVLGSSKFEVDCIRVVRAAAMALDHASSLAGTRFVD